MEREKNILVREETRVMGENIINVLDFTACLLGMIPESGISASVGETLRSFFDSFSAIITDTQLYEKTKSITGTTTYEEVSWIEEYISVAGAKQFITSRFNPSSEIKKYIQQVVDNNNIGEQEKIVVLLAHLECYLHTIVKFEYGNRIKDKLKAAIESSKNVSDRTNDICIIYAIINIIYASGDHKEFDRRLPHRNDILHHGTIDYTADQIKQGYELLLGFIYYLEVMSRKYKFSETLNED